MGIFYRRDFRRIRGFSGRVHRVFDPTSLKINLQLGKLGLLIFEDKILRTKNDAVGKKRQKVAGVHGDESEDESRLKREKERQTQRDRPSDRSRGANRVVSLEATKYNEGKPPQ